VVARILAFAALLSFAALAGAETPAWVERSNKIAAEVLRDRGQFFPEGPSSAGQEEFDTAVADFGPNLFERSLAQTEKRLAALRALRAAETDPKVRQDLDIPLDYSSFGLEVGYFLTPSVQMSFLWRKLWSHGGLSFNELFEAPPEVFVNLDRVVRASYDHVGAAVSFRIGQSVSAYANYLWFVSGIDAHYGAGFSVGLSWSFRTSRADDVPLFPPADPVAGWPRSLPLARVRSR